MTIVSINEPGTTRVFTLTPMSINEPVAIELPTLEGLNPAEAPIGNVLLVVHGSNFTEDTVIQFNGVAVPTTFEKENKVNATLELTTAGDFPVTVARGPYVVDPPLTFTVNEGVDPDALEDEIEQAREDGDFKPLHRGRPSTTLPKNRKK